MTNEAKSTVPVSLIGLPYLMGTRQVQVNNHMARGPRVLLDENAVPARVREAFEDVEVIMIEDADDPTPEHTGGDYRLLPVGDQMSRILVENICLSRQVRKAREAGRVPVVSLGTCSNALGMVGGIGDVEGDLGMIWFDAHGDAMTPDTSENGFFEGMPVTTIAGHCWPRYRRKIPGFREIPEENMITVGLSEMHSANARHAAGYALGNLVHKPVIEELGFEDAMVRALDDLRTRCDKLYVHFDTDCLEPSICRSNTHAADGGLLPEQAARAFELIAERFTILTLAFSAYDPQADERAPETLVPLMVKAVEATVASQTK